MELEKRILTYNSRYNNIWNFGGFHSFIGQVMIHQSFLNDKKRLYFMLGDEPRGEGSVFPSYSTWYYRLGDADSGESDSISSFTNATESAVSLYVPSTNRISISQRVPEHLPAEKYAKEAIRVLYLS